MARSTWSPRGIGRPRRGGRDHRRLGGFRPALASDRRALGRDRRGDAHGRSFRPLIVGRRRSSRCWSSPSWVHSDLHRCLHTQATCSPARRSASHSRWVLYRTLAPEAVFLISSDGRKTAHLDVEGTRGEAIRLGLDTQLGIEASDIGGRARRVGRLDATADRSGRRRGLLRQALRQEPPVRIARTSCGAPSSTGGSRTRSTSRRFGGSCSTRTTCCT